MQRSLFPARPLAAFSLTLGLLLNAAVTASAADKTWPQWRGPHRDSTLQADAWPNQLKDGALKKLWSVDLEPSYSGPIVMSDRVFVTETVDKKFEVVRALSRKTGKQIWETKWEGSLKVPFFAASNGSWIRSTPACDGKLLFVAGMRDVLVCLNAADGKEVWKVDFVKEFKSPVPSFGFVCSPLLHDNAVFVQAGGGVVKLEKTTGKILWRSMEDGGGMLGSAFSSPVIGKVAGQTQLLVQSRKALAGLDLNTGKVLWSQDVPAFRGMNIVPPTVLSEDRIFTSSYGGGSFLYQVVAGDDGFEVKTLWKSKLQGYMSSPMEIDGALYFHMKNQRFACVDIATGKDNWITTPFGKYWSSVVNNGALLSLDQKGELLLINPQDEAFELVDSLKVSDQETWAHLAVVGNEIYIRDLKGLTAYRWSTTP